jgi:hypothetical protein
MRTLDRILAIVLGLAGFAFGVLVVAEVINAAFSRPPLLLPYRDAAAFLRERPWSDGVIVAVAALLLAAGLLLLIAELKPRRPPDTPVRGPTDDHHPVDAQSRPSTGERRHPDCRRAPSRRHRPRSPGTSAAAGADP